MKSISHLANEKRIMITGGAGLIGTALTRFLRDCGSKVLIFDSLKSFNDLADAGFTTCLEKRISLLTGSDLRIGSTALRSEIETALDAFRPDVVLHLGMCSTVAEAELDPIYAENSIVDGTRQTIESCAGFSVKHFFYVSSSMVYGNFGSRAIEETATCEPVNLYGKLKLRGEELTKAICEANRMPYSIVRPISVYGPNDNPRRLIASFLDQALKKGKIEYRNPILKMDFTHIDDFVSGISGMLLNPSCYQETFNISYGEAHSIFDVLTIFKKNLGEIELVNLEDDSAPLSRGALSIEKARSKFGFTPKISLEQGLTRLIQEARSTS